LSLHGVLLVPAGAFENTVQALYKYVVPKPREQCSKTEQLTVSFAAGYIAGVFCAVVSHPADNLVSKLNAQKGATVGDIVKQMGWYASHSWLGPAHHHDRVYRPAGGCQGQQGLIWMIHQQL